MEEKPKSLCTYAGLFCMSLLVGIILSIVYASSILSFFSMIGIGWSIFILLLIISGILNIATAVGLLK